MVKPVIDAGFSSSLADLLATMLAKKAYERLSMDDVIGSIYFVESDSDDDGEGGDDDDASVIGDGAYSRLHTFTNSEDGTSSASASHYSATSVSSPLSKSSALSPPSSLTMMPPPRSASLKAASMSGLPPTVATALRRDSLSSRSGRQSQNSSADSDMREQRRNDKDTSAKADATAAVTAAVTAALRKSSSSSSPSHLALPSGSRQGSGGGDAAVGASKKERDDLTEWIHYSRSRERSCDVMFVFYTLCARTSHDRSAIIYTTVMYGRYLGARATRAHTTVDIIDLQRMTSSVPSSVKSMISVIGSVGGGLKSPLRQPLSSVTETPLSTPATTPTAANPDPLAGLPGKQFGGGGGAAAKKSKHRRSRSDGHKLHALDIKSLTIGPPILKAKASSGDDASKKSASMTTPMRKKKIEPSFKKFGAKFNLNLTTPQKAVRSKSTSAGLDILVDGDGDGDVDVIGVIGAPVEEHAVFAGHSRSRSYSMALDHNLSDDDENSDNDITVVTAGAGAGSDETLNTSRLTGVLGGRRRQTLPVNSKNASRTEPSSPSSMRSSRRSASPDGMLTSHHSRQSSGHGSIGSPLLLSPSSAMGSPNNRSPRTFGANRKRGNKHMKSYEVTEDSFHSNAISISASGMTAQSESARNSVIHSRNASISDSLDEDDMSMLSGDFSDAVSTVLHYDDLVHMKVIGRGQNGSVLQCWHAPTLHTLAVKTMNIHDRSSRHQLVHELTALVEIDNPFFLKLMGACFADGQVVIALQYMDRGSMQSLVLDKGPFPQTTLRPIVEQVFKGLAYLHSTHRIHRDIKPDNILINRRGEAKIADFGLLKKVGADNVASTFLGTMMYLSPERVRSEKYGYPADVWAVGMTIIYCLTGELPFPPSDYWGLRDKIQSWEPKGCLSGDDFSAETCALVEATLQFKQSERGTAESLLTHAFFTVDAAALVSPTKKLASSPSSPAAKEQHWDEPLSDLTKADKAQSSKMLRFYIDHYMLLVSSCILLQRSVFRDDC
jgi:serine/threonine protein kinase